MRLFDIILAPVLVLLAWQVLWVKDLFVGIVLFIFFGLLCALAWVELDAPDIAMVEAAIGAGLIGALLLGSLGHIEEGGREKRAPFLWPLALALAALISLVVLNFPEEGASVAPLVRENLSLSGVDNPVTAVILNFRAYDTLLEIGVLFLVAVAVVAVGVGSMAQRLEESPMLLFFLHLLIPMIALVGGLLLWAGAAAPGGAFQAGALFAAGGILLFLGRARFALDYRRLPLRLLAACGFAGFILIGLVGGFLFYREEEAKISIFLIEILATASIATVLLTLFAVCAGFLTKEEAK